MATWTIRTQTSDFKRALEMAEDQQKKGYTVWIEDESSGALTNGLSGMRRPIALFARSASQPFLSGAITVGIGGLYLIDVWVDRVW
jgi:hypothetical protein